MASRNYEARISPVARRDFVPKVDANDPTTNYVGHNLATLSKHIAQRNIQNSVTYMISLLDSLQPEFTFLDVGCGPGSITIDIAKRYPRATILALDGPGPLQHARAAAAAAGATNIRFAVGDALDLTATAATAEASEFAALRGGCDVAHTHNVLLHVTDAALAVRQLATALKPGGYLCCKEGDRGVSPVLVHPEPHPAMRATHELMSVLMSTRGCDPYVGRKLKALALGAGFAAGDMVCAGLSTWLVSSREEREKWGALVLQTAADEDARKQISEEARKVGRELDWDAVQRAWRDWIDIKSAWAVLGDPYLICRKAISP